MTQINRQARLRGPVQIAKMGDLRKTSLRELILLNLCLIGDRPPSLCAPRLRLSDVLRWVEHHPEYADAVMLALAACRRPTD